MGSPHHRSPQTDPEEAPQSGGAPRRQWGFFHFYALYAAFYGTCRVPNFCDRHIIGAAKD